GDQNGLYPTPSHWVTGIFPHLPVLRLSIGTGVQQNHVRTRGCNRPATRRSQCMSDVLGLDRYMHEAYRVLLKHRECTTNDVADRLGISRPQAEQTLARLTAAGLAATTHSTDSVKKTEAVVPLDPRRSLAPLLGRKQAQLAAQQQELARAHETVASLAAENPAVERGRRKDRSARTDLSDGVRAFRTRIEELPTPETSSVV